MELTPMPKVIDLLRERYKRSLKAHGPNALSTRSLRQKIEAYEAFGDKGLGQAFQMRPVDTSDELDPETD